MNDVNGEELLEGVEPLNEEFMAKQQNHRWKSCPNYTAGGFFTAQNAMQMMSPTQQALTPIQVMVCRCGAILQVPLR